MTREEKYISRCFELAKKGIGNTAPNPLVGCVIVKNDKIIGEGFHKKYGSAHAEPEAIINASEDVKDAELYCCLEPCSHKNKQTPPCVPLIIEKGIRKVIISNPDPNPFVSGNGISRLRNAGIEVVENVLQETGEELNRFYFTSVIEQRPYVTLKLALSNDGFINRLDGIRTKISGNEADIYVHRLRAEYGAVMAGANTVKVDNPKLNVRLTEGRSPLRIVIDGLLSAPINSQIYNDESRSGTWVFCAGNADQFKIEELNKLGVKLFTQQDQNAGKVDLKLVLEELYRNKITSLLVEGGANLFDQFINQSLFDEIVLIKSRLNFGEGVSPETLKNVSNLNRRRLSEAGDDMIEILRKPQEV
jgi:diaminohydroxyphosphoribosylaminopyrimidine deaminase / 5-amino-6-(5-phosphoribosylamino)uracil reductase